MLDAPQRKIALHRAARSLFLVSAV
jgi:hypothetical protein